MKFLVVVCLLAVAAADEEKNQEKKTQSVDSTQNTAAGLTQPTGTLLNGQIFPSPFTSTLSSLAYTGLNGNLSPIQTVNPDFFNAGVAQPIVNGAISSFPTTRTILPGTSSVVNGVQPGFPVATSGIFPGVISGIGSQYPGVGTNVLSSVAGVPSVTGGANGVVSPVTPYRFLTPEGFSAIPTQGLQTAQTIGLSNIPSFTSGILSPLSNGVFQGQTIPSGILKNPTGTTTSGISNIPSLPAGNLSSGTSAGAFRHN